MVEEVKEEEEVMVEEEVMEEVGAAVLGELEVEVMEEVVEVVMGEVLGLYMLAEVVGAMGVGVEVVMEVEEVMQEVVL